MQCAACSDTVAGLEHIRAAEFCYHVDCFKCSLCGAVLDKQFIMDGNRPQCATCNYKNCGKCGELLLGSFLEVNDEKLHPQCFACSTCNLGIAEDTGARQIAGSYFCSSCYEGRHPSSAACHRCGQPCSTSLTALDKSWHPECFTCNVCGIQIGTQPFRPLDDGACCALHFDQLCCGCGLLIANSCIVVDGDHYHKECKPRERDIVTGLTQVETRDVAQRIAVPYRDVATALKDMLGNLKKVNDDNSADAENLILGPARRAGTKAKEILVLFAELRDSPRSTPVFREDLDAHSNTVRGATAALLVSAKEASASGSQKKLVQACSNLSRGLQLIGRQLAERGISLFGSDSPTTSKEKPSGVPPGSPRSPASPARARANGLGGALRWNTEMGEATGWASLAVKLAETSKFSDKMCFATMRRCVLTSAASTTSLAQPRVGGRARSKMMSRKKSTALALGDGAVASFIEGKKYVETPLGRTEMKAYSSEGGWTRFQSVLPIPLLRDTALSTSFVRVMVFIGRYEADGSFPTPTCIGSAVVSLKDTLVPGAAIEAQLRGTGAIAKSGTPGSVSVEMEIVDMDPQHPGEERRCYLMETREGTTLLLRETLSEDPRGCTAPRPLLELLLERAVVDMQASTAALKAAEDAAEGDGGRRSDIGDLQDRCARLRKRVEALRQGVEGCAMKQAVASDGERVTFKASIRKGDVALRYLPTNLHRQCLRITARRTNQAIAHYDTISVGAFAAHTCGFKRLGLRQLNDEFKNLPGKTQTQRSAAEALRGDIAFRADEAICQGFVVLQAAFANHLNGALRHHCTAEAIRLLDQLACLGFVFQVESLVSTHGGELGMLGDMAGVMRELASFSFVLRFAPSGGFQGGPPGVDDEHPFTIRRARSHLSMSGAMPLGGDSYIVEVPVRCPSGVTIPLSLLSGDSIKVVPLLFTQGINEMQAMANLMHSTTTKIQNDINDESLTQLRIYFRTFKLWERNYAAPPAPPCCQAQPDRRCVAPHTIPPNTGEMEDDIEEIDKGNQKLAKDAVVLRLAASVVRGLSMSRVTCCKSAKDRTSMSITLEQSHLLATRHGLHEDEVMATANMMRSVGVRRANVAKNTGQSQYAFNALQRSCLPPLYQPPPGAAGYSKS